MEYIRKYLEYLKVIKKYSEKTLESYKEDLIEYNEFLGNNFTSIIKIDKTIVNSYLKYLREKSK